MQALASRRTAPLWTVTRCSARALRTRPACERESASARQAGLSQSLALKSRGFGHSASLEQRAPIEKKSGRGFGFGLAASVAAAGIAVAGTGFRNQQGSADAGKAQADAENLEPTNQELVNWSGTHVVTTPRYYEPETLEELKAIVADAHSQKSKLRPVGSGLSPNGLGFCSGGMINIAQMDEIVHVDAEQKRVTVQAGARVSQVVEALRPHGLTLQNYASIAEQQIGGFVQVGAHGTGVAIPPVDEQVVAMKLITPAAGEVDLSAQDDDPSLFYIARTALGLLGVVAEVTLQCVPAHQLVEHTFTSSRADVRKNHAKWLQENKHLRYMWIPSTDTVVVVSCNPVPKGVSVDHFKPPSESMERRLQPARDLLKSAPGVKRTHAEIDELSFTGLRDELLKVDPLNPAWVKLVNEAEAEYWRRSQGYRVEASDRILGFDCGGEQWVSEIAFPVYAKQTEDGESHVDLQFVEDTLAIIEKNNIPAPAPIEQRWTSPSMSPLSPASEKPERPLPQYYSWVGIIMYLPEDSESASTSADASRERERITAAFHDYKAKCEKQLWPKVHAVEHWAKIEMPKTEEELGALRVRMHNKYPLIAFAAIRNLFDPHHVLSNDITDAILTETLLQPVAMSRGSGA